VRMTPVRLVELIVKLERGSGVDRDYVKIATAHYKNRKGFELISS